MRLRLARHPHRLKVKHPILIEELLELEQRGKQKAVAAMLAMLEDLHESGRGSRFLSKLTGTPLWELKPASRGGEKGGARVYLFVLEDDEAGVVNCEVKEGVVADREKLRVGLEIVVAYKRGVRVFEEPEDVEEA
jgi:hypothetical protein